VRHFIARNILDAPFDGDEAEGTDIQPGMTNFKSALQELAQSRKLSQPKYTIVSERGPEHSKTFTVEVRVGKEWSGQAEGRTKKIAAPSVPRGESTSGCSGRSTKQQNRRSLIDVAQVFFP